ncbi:response regulator transcription factor [Paenibacillus puldeungensis]|uniref:Response regulator transcription factor n=1 Tax=Paenibacillus puldeungensis TaxID=696536 RepID=A0ABW3RSS2_9BACL
MSKIVIVDDDLFILQLISEYLKKEGYEVTSFNNGQTLIQHIRDHRPDCLILDIMMPGIDGLSLLRQLRTFTEMPIMMISARGEEIDRIQGLEMGCSDFLSKPFNPRELVGRVKALLRLVQAGASEQGARKNQESQSDHHTYLAGNAAVSEEYRQVTVEGKEVNLTQREFELLAFLASHLDRPFSREHIIQQVWNYDFLGDVRVVDDLVKRIRKKLVEKEATLMIDTVWGFGYKATVRESEHAYH